MLLPMAAPFSDMCQFLYSPLSNDLQRLATGIILAVVDRKLEMDDRGIHIGVDRALARCISVLPIQCQVCGIEAGPLSCAYVDVQGDHADATLNHQV